MIGAKVIRDSTAAKISTTAATTATPAPVTTLVIFGATGDQTLFQPILDAWSRGGAAEPYAAGGSGPPGAEALMTRERRNWRPLNR